ncbi:hypothetical protein DFH06DRAFT_1125492 [Mycena polygramma]|nr:hypothetical protein DFH06DRAFT_1125492 [Mycena polygramma]
MQELMLPVLPEDLERDIFELSAHSCRLSTLRLMLVARRVKIWVEPLLYQSLVSRSFVWSHIGAVDYPVLRGLPTLLDIVETKGTSSFLRDRVRNLMLPSFAPGDINTVAAILSACSGVQNLYMNVASALSMPTLLPILAQLPLTRLCCNVQFLFGPRSQIDFTHQLFAQITHIEVFDKPRTRVDGLKSWSNLALVPHLTHVSFVDPSFISVSPALLCASNSLRAVVVMAHRWAAQPLIDSQPDGEKLLKDPRFVVMDYIDMQLDWQVGAHGRMDYWWRANDFIARRRAGEVESPFLEDIMMGNKQGSRLKW